MSRHTASEIDFIFFLFILVLEDLHEDYIFIRDFYAYSVQALLRSF